MNSVQFHIGDWMTRTAHLDWIDQAAYLNLLMAYYVAEAPLPPSIKLINKTVGAMTRQEKEAVQRMLDKFFVQDESGNWHQHRCDEDIAKRKAFQLEQAKKANIRWNNETGDNFDSYTRKKSVKHPIPDAHSQVLPLEPRETPGDQERLKPDAAGNAAGITAGNAKPLTVFNSTLKTHSLNVETARSAAGVCVSVGINVEPTNSRLLALVADGAGIGDFAEAARLAAVAGKGWAYAAGIVANFLTDPQRQAQEGPASGLEALFRPGPRAH